MKTKIALVAGILIALAAAVAMTILLSPSVPVPPRAWAPRAAQWKSREAISVTTHTGDYGAQKGDAFPYYVDVWYDPTVVAEIEKDSLDGAVDLTPFEVRSVKESDLTDGHGMQVYRREYEIQLVAGETNHLYEFPSIIVRYRPVDSAGLLNVEANPQPIYVASRLPANVDDFELMPIAPTVVDDSQRSLPWTLWGLGAILILAAAGDLTWRVIPRWKGMHRSTRSSTEGGVVAEAYRALCDAANSAEPQRVFHQLDHVLRLVLVSRDDQSWLEEPSLEQVPSEVRERVALLFDTCQKAYRPGPIEQEEVQKAVAELRSVLAHYFGEQEVEAWRN